MEEAKTFDELMHQDGGQLGEEARRRAVRMLESDVIDILSILIDAESDMVGMGIGNMMELAPKTLGGQAIKMTVLFVLGVGDKPMGRWELMGSDAFDEYEFACFEMAKSCPERMEMSLPCLVNDCHCGAVGEWLNVFVVNGGTPWPPERQQLRECAREPGGQGKASARL